MSDQQSPNGKKDSPLSQSYLDAMSRMEERAVVRPEESRARATELLAERFGQSGEDVSSGFSHGDVALVSEHTHYFNGFALLRPLRQGTAVAVRRGPAPGEVAVAVRNVGQLSDQASEAGGVVRPDRVQEVLGEVAHRLVPGLGLEVAVVSDIDVGYPDTYLSTLVVAGARAILEAAGLSRSRNELLQELRAIMERKTGMPQSIAYVIAADVSSPDAFILIDTATHEHISVERPDDQTLGWGLVSVHDGALRPPGFYRERRERTDEICAQLQRKGFALQGTLRELEHRDLDRALQAVSRNLRPLLRHLVTENRRVQRLLVATRRQDWQMFGALLFMSHNSLKNDWGSTSEEADFVVSRVEAMTEEGMFGACLGGRSGCVLVVGRPFVVPNVLDSISTAFRDKFGREARGLLL
jgi:galactokinase